MSCPTATSSHCGPTQPPPWPRTFPASVSLSVKHEGQQCLLGTPHPQVGHWAMQALGGTHGKVYSKQQRGRLGSCSFPALGCPGQAPAAHPWAQPCCSRPQLGLCEVPAACSAPGSRLCQTQITSLSAFSKLCPHAGHFTTSEPQSLVSRPGVTITHAPWGVIPSILLQPREPLPLGSLPAVPRGVSHTLPWPQEFGAPSICSSCLPSDPTLGHDIPEV